jgi:hypothetical protein
MKIFQDRWKLPCKLVECTLMAWVATGGIYFRRTLKVLAGELRVHGLTGLVEQGEYDRGFGKETGEVTPVHVHCPLV